MYDERKQDGFGIGDALVSLALILGGGTVGRKMVGATAIPSRKELEALVQAIKASGSRAMNTPLSEYVAAAQQRADSLYNRAFVKPQLNLDLPAATIGDYTDAAHRGMQRTMRDVIGATQRLKNVPVRNPLAPRPTQLSFKFDNPF